jgi:hypothetical protein
MAARILPSTSTVAVGRCLTCGHDNELHYEDVHAQSFCNGAELSCPCDEWATAESHPELARTSPDVSALTQLLQEQLRFEQDEVSAAHAVLTAARIPTNGVGGRGKREELSLAQRIDTALNTRPSSPSLDVEKIADAVLSETPCVCYDEDVRRQWIIEGVQKYLTEKERR